MTTITEKITHINGVTIRQYLLSMAVYWTNGSSEVFWHEAVCRALDHLYGPKYHAARDWFHALNEAQYARFQAEVEKAIENQ